MSQLEPRHRNRDITTAKDTTRKLQQDPKLTIQIDPDLRKRLRIYSQQIEKPIRHIISELL